MFAVSQASVTEASEDMGIVFCFVLCVVGFSGFVYAIASAACEFLYRNNEYYEIKKKNGWIEGMLRAPYFPAF